MKSLTTICQGLACLSCMLLVSCPEPAPVYVPYPVPVERKAAPKKPTYKPKPKPVETAEDFRPVEKPATYSN